uniref:CCHC-type domain-containing protein n=1 Tax=Oryza glumipatula TaxID=40148 RepID=A0A0E0B823_9ORYZ
MTQSAWEAIKTVCIGTRRVHEWLARLKNREQSGESSGTAPDAAANAGSKKRGNRRGRGRGQEHPGDKCRSCGKMGHWAKDCRSKPKKAEAHIAAEDDDEPTLLMARVDGRYRSVSTVNITKIEEN